MTGFDLARRWWSSPILLISLFSLAVMALLSARISLPIGPNYWDLMLYADATHRLQQGQQVALDYFAPVGPLGYWLLAMVQAVFPKGHLLLQVQWCVLLVALPAMILAAMGADRQSRLASIAMLVPFLICAALPINTVELYPSPGFDGFGLYNRHSALMLYTLVSVIVFVGPPRLRSVIVSLLLAALFTTKITGFIAGGIITVAALFNGKLRWRDLAWLALPALAIITALQIWNGIISAYLSDVAELVALNQGALLPRILTVLSLHLPVITAGAALPVFLIWNDWTQSRITGLSALLRSDGVWLAAIAAALTVFETQNTGSQELIGLWPAIVAAQASWVLSQNRRAIAMAMVAIFATLAFANLMHRGARAIASAPTYRALPIAVLDKFGGLVAKPEFIERTDAMREHYITQREAYGRLAASGHLPSSILPSEIDFQILWLITLDEAVDAIKAHEARTGTRLASLYTIDFTDVLPMLLNRKSVRHMPVGADPSRTVPKANEQAMAELAKVDAILVPLCPVMSAREELRTYFAPALAGRRGVALSPCWQMWLKN
jgi:hypothetical protein